MAFPIGIDAATQRIDEIRQRFQAFESQPQQQATALTEGKSFQQILQDNTQPSLSPNLSNPNPMENLVASQAQQVGLDPDLAKAVAKAESGFNPNAVSPAGAKGLMQLMPSTAQGLGVQSLLDPTQNAKGGTKYLKSLIDKYHTIPTALAAYNAGPGAVERFGGVPPYKETQGYIQRVLSYQNQFKQQDGE